MKLINRFDNPVRAGVYIGVTAGIAVYFYKSTKTIMFSVDKLLAKVVNNVFAEAKKATDKIPHVDVEVVEDDANDGE